MSHYLEILGELKGDLGIAGRARNCKESKGATGRARELQGEQGIAFYCPLSSSASVGGYLEGPTQCFVCCSNANSEHNCVLQLNF